MDTMFLDTSLQITDLLIVKLTVNPSVRTYYLLSCYFYNSFLIVFLLCGMTNVSYNMKCYRKDIPQSSKQLYSRKQILLQSAIYTSHL